MLRMRSVFPLAAAFLIAAPLSAAPRPGDKAEGPAVVAQARSLHDLLEMVKTTVKNVAGEAMYQEFEKHALPNLDFKKIPGIDPKRPFGLYAVLDADIARCRAVLLVPVVSEKDFFDMLTQFEIPVNKGKEPGTFEFVTPPDIPFPVAGRIHKEYAYIALGGVDVLDTKAILDPKDVINDKEKAPAYLALHLDRVPSETKKALVGMLRERTEHLGDNIPDADLKAAFNSARNLALRYLKLVCDEGKELAFRLEADTKTGDVFVEMTLDPLPKTDLAETIAKRKPTTNRFASLAGDDSAQRLFVSAPMFADEVKDAINKLLDAGSKVMDRAGPGVSPEGIALYAAFFKSLKATYATGELDLAAALRGPNKDGFYTAVGAVSCKEGAQLEKALRDAIKTLPDRERGFFKFDAAKIGDLVVHEIDLTTEAAEPLQKIFGKGNIAYFAFGKDALYAAYGPDGMKLLKEAIDAKPGPAAVLDSASDRKKMADVMKRMMPENQPNVAMRTGWLESVSMGMRVTVEGGERLKVRAGMNVGGAFMWGFGFYAAEARPAAPPVAVPAKR
jgi:hypothetical protein